MMISASAGMLGGGRMQYDLRRCMIFLDALTMNKPEVFIGGAMQKFDEKTGQLKDEQAVGFIKQQLAAFAKFIEQHGGKS
jgi:chromate reductase